VLHGFTGNPYSMRPLAEALNQRGFAVDLPRLPGHGTHWRDLMRTRYSDWFAEAERAFEALRRTSARIVVIGLSMGGTLALDLASRRNRELAGVVTINAAILDRKDLAAKLAPLLERIVFAVPAKAAGLTPNDIAKPGGDERAYPIVPSAAGNSLMRELPRIRDALPTLRAPMLVAWSRADHSVPPENSRSLQRLAGSNDVTELILERSYHVATLDYDFDLLVDSITAFADRLKG
jgi:carboxylesterase